MSTERWAEGRIDSAADGLIRTLFAEAFNDLKGKCPAWEKLTPPEGV